jgi:Alginate export
MGRRGLFALLTLCAITAVVRAEDEQSTTSQTPQRIQVGGVTVSGSVRVRGEAWDWFLRDSRTQYAYGQSLVRLAIGQRRNRFDWKLELAQPTLVGLPSDAVVAGSGEPLGLGATYFAANGGQRNSAAVFLKQAFISFKGFGTNGSHLRIGRFEFSDGLEVKPPDETLAALKRDRLANRLIGDAGWTVAGRSFDGLKLSYDRDEGNISLLAARATEGVYQTDGLREMDVDVLYAAYTRQIPAPLATSELRVFAAGYHDGRGVLKTDNRPLALRQADTANIRIGTFGGHFISAWKTPIGKWDALLWGAAQTGRWGVLDHRANVIDVELGWHPRGIWGKPWLRASAFRASGDPNPNDTHHETFFQMLPTNQQYARIPFYTFLNTLDFTGQLVMQLHPRLLLHSQVHKVKLTKQADLWYQGTGAFQNSSFGYEGTPSGGRGGLANYLDTSIQYRATSHLDMTFYVGALSGKAVMTSLTHGRKGGMAYIEMQYSF